MQSDGRVRLKCEECDRTKGVKKIAAMTAYVYEGEPGSPDDPNKDLYLCVEHAKEYTEYWQAMWDEYNAGRG